MTARPGDSVSGLAAPSPVSGRPSAFPIPAILDEKESQLRAAYDHFRAATRSPLSFSYAAEWVLDNYYVVQQAIRQIREDMPKAFYRQLPKRDDHQPRILSLAREIVKRTDCLLDLDQITRGVEWFQKSRLLTMGELWALPTMLRLDVLDQLTGALVELISRPRNVDAQGDDQPASEESIVANGIVSLRLLAAQDWKQFFESASVVEEVLGSDHEDTYADMDFETRDSYRKAVEELSIAAASEEPEVARLAVQLAAEARAKGESARSAHVGFYFVDAGRRRLEARLGHRPSRYMRLHRWLSSRADLVYLSSIALLTLLVALALVVYAGLAGGSRAQQIGIFLLVVLPATVVAVDLVNTLVSHLLPPRLLPKMDYRHGVSPKCRTMVVIPSMLTSPGEVHSLLRQLELHYLGNPEAHLHFALLTDFGDAPQEHMPGDDALLAQAEAGIRDLCQRHCQGASDLFYLFHRRRQWNPSEECWMGWERKRGKLAEFNRLLSGQETTIEVQIGDLSILGEVRYVITLDADTVLPRGSARRLIGTLAHPLNRVEADPESGVIVAGYTVLQPRVQVNPASGNRSLFTRVFSRDTGLDLYTRAVSDVYQDLFGEGNYVGKGIYDVTAFERSLAGRVPDNRVLSHDLFEGIHGRAGLVTDVVLFEDYPPHYLAYVHRMHRWVRGDWQLLPWLLGEVPNASQGRRSNGLGTLDRWKILDNLLRSLLGPAIVVLLIAGWLLLPGSVLLWTGSAVLPLALPLLADVASGLANRLRNRASAAVSKAEQADALRSLLAVVFLPYEALVTLDAIGTTLYRLTISRKHLLQWTSAAHDVRAFGKEIKASQAWRHMAGAPSLAAATAVLVLLVNPLALPVAAPFLLLWLISPDVAYRIGRPETHGPAPLADDQRRRVRCLARRTWLFFEYFVGPEGHWLPPDHFQEDPRGAVAYRTSPTNVGLLLLSTLGAHDLGFIGPLELSLRLTRALEEMGHLERYRGHFLNWYDIGKLEPLPPRYVSVVDSGNLAACLVTLAQGCGEMPRTTLLRWERLQGVLDILDSLAEMAEQADLGARAAAFGNRLSDLRDRIEVARERPTEWFALLRKSDEDCRELEQVLVSVIESSPEVLDAETFHSLHLWVERGRHHLSSFQRELELLQPWVQALSRAPARFTSAHAGREVTDAWSALLSALPSTPRLGEVAEICETAARRLDELRQAEAGRDRDASEWCAALALALESARRTTTDLLCGFRELRVRALACSDEMDFRFLLDPQRQVFHIGYNVDAGKLDDNHYDLMASEARLASLLAIARGDAPQSHWLHLARPLTRVGRESVLLSWSGSMFEYLMPTLLVRSYDGTLLDRSCRAAVDYQIAYGRRKAVPWGISESSFYRFDANMNYQYQAFGVPRLGFKRGLAEDLVVAPYASLLALSLRPRAVMRNIDRLAENQVLGLYGFYESVDFTPARISGRKRGVVRTYMAHHQGMILLSFVNYLKDDRMVRRFHSDLRIRSVELLLREQLPAKVRIEVPHPKESGGVFPPAPKSAASEPWQPAIDLTLPQVHYLSNGHYGVLVTSAGGGFSRWREMDLTRWRADTTMDDWGTWIYVRDRESNELWSACHQPTAVPPESQQVLFFPHKAQFQRREHDISLRLEVTVVPDQDIEIRRLSLTDHSGRRRRLALTSYAEVVLAPHDADRRHPAFNKLFIESEYLPEVSGLLLRRRRRSLGEEPICLLHLVTVEGERTSDTVYESDRAQFLGRGGTRAFPAALRTVGEHTGTVGAVLDPIMALQQEIVVEPHGEAVVAFITLAARSRRQALNLARGYLAWPKIERAFDRARAHGEQDLSQFELTSQKLERIQRLLSALLFPHADLRAAPAMLFRNQKGQTGLWPYAISGDYPILLVQIASEEEVELLQDALKAHAYWRQRGPEIDLVILSQEEGSYEQKLTGKLRRLIGRSGGDAWMNRRGGIFLLHADQMNEADRVLLETAARVILDGRSGTLADQLESARERPHSQPRFVPTRPLSPPSAAAATSSPDLIRPTDLLFDNGLGGFSADGKEYVIYLEPGEWTPSPWINVIANSEFGFLVSEAGSGYTWAQNSGENRLTPWRNDPVADAPGEALYLRDEETGEVWSPTPLPARTAAPYLIRHGAGYSVFEHRSHGVEQYLRLFAVPDAPVKVVRLRLRNTRSYTRRVTVTYYAEWVLGASRETSQSYTVSEFDSTRFALLVRNPHNEEFGQRIAFLAGTRECHGVTADRTEFLGRMGNYIRPAALDRVGLANRVEPGADPCAAMQSLLWLAPGEEKEITFLLGQGADRQETLRLIAKYQNIEQIDAAWRQLTELWDELLSAVTVRTPDPAMDLLLNRWLLYQSLSCRVWGRSALYQSSGAFGYRDQLQDVMALVHASPETVREHIVRAAGRQFAAGDVLHWWHPPSGRGVRTRCSDDLLWLPFVTAHYVSVTDDLSILDEPAPWLEGAPLEEEETERHGLWEKGSEATLYRHRWPRRKRLAGLVPPHHADPFRLPLRARGRRRPGRRVPATSRGPRPSPGRRCLGRRLVSPRLLRRRHAAGLGREPRVPDRLHRPIVGRALRGRGFGPRSSGDGIPRRSARAGGGSAAVALRAAVRPDGS
jgi:cyclic beta-1,2-glucan synthetase